MMLKKYEKIEEGIYKIKDGYGELYVTSLTFEQEPEFDEGENATDISQYPLENILDKFLVHISDFYDDMNTADSKICYQEFAGLNLKSTQDLRGIIGKHVYNKE